jgi:hypothetical protein
VVVAHSIAMMANGAEAKTAGVKARARASMPARITGMRMARFPADAVTVLPATKSTPDTAKATPIWAADAPAACSCSGTRRTETPVVPPAITMAAAAAIVLRSDTAARRLRPIGAGGGDWVAGTRSSARAPVSTAKHAAATRNGLARPK